MGIMVYRLCTTLIIINFLTRSCIVCPVTDSKSMRVLSDEQRTMIFLTRGIWVPKGVRCCSNHLYKGYLSYEARQSVKQSKVDDIILNQSDVEKLIDDFLSISMTQELLTMKLMKQLLDLIEVYYLIVLIKFFYLPILNFRSF
jgi:hypothetical protein